MKKTFFTLSLIFFAILSFGQGALPIYKMVANPSGAAGSVVVYIEWPVNAANTNVTTANNRVVVLFDAAAGTSPTVTNVAGSWTKDQAFTAAVLSAGCGSNPDSYDLMDFTNGTNIVSGNRASGGVDTLFRLQFNVGAYDVRLSTGINGSSASSSFDACANSAAQATIRYRPDGSTNYTTYAINQSSATLPLPVELLSFTANWQGDDAVVEWTTATEINNSHFNVERSFDGVSFEYVATVASQAVGGNSKQLLDYAYTDEAIKNRTNNFLYYRLIQTDFDGASETFGPEVLQVQRSSKPSISLYPVPAHNEVTVQVNTPANSSNYALQVIDAIGVVVAEYTVDAARETTATKLDISNLPSGAYWIQVVGDNVSLNTQKFIKINE